LKSSKNYIRVSLRSKKRKKIREISS
jgi:hypothetical protein